MKFGEQILAHLTPEWRKQYVQYEELKKLIYDAFASEEGGGDVEQTELSAEQMRQHSVRFFALADDELTKVNLFYSMKIAEAQRKYHELQHDLDVSKAQLLQQDSAEKSKTRLFGGKDERSKNVQKLKFAFSEYYLNLVLIQNYQQLNNTGFRKILKKYDKLFQTDKGKMGNLKVP